MAEFALAASVIGLLSFTIQLWEQGSDVIKSGSTISTTDCAREATSLQGHCERVKSLQDAETELDEAARIKAIAEESRLVAEQLAASLAKCQLPPGLKGWRRYRDAIPVLWHGMHMDADAQMARLEALRNELQSEILVSMSRKVNLSDLRNSQGFRKLDGEVKSSTMTILQEQASLKSYFEASEEAAKIRHNQIMSALQGCRPTQYALTEVERDEVKTKVERITQLTKRLWFNTISTRHNAIARAHAGTFEWIFTGQSKAPESNKTILEWINDENSVYWVSGRAGSGKSSLMRFLGDDPRTKKVLREWAGGSSLVLASFYFWNSEAAGGNTLKSLSGLYRGIFHNLISSDHTFAEILFPEYVLDGHQFDDDFPTLPHLTSVFERLYMATDLPAAVVLLIDGLDEYEAESSDQMKLAENLRQASKSTNLKIIVSSRPETAFEIAFRGANKLRLHELTENDRRKFVSDKLGGEPRLSTIATEEEQSELINLVVERSEGIFLWTRLAVETLILEIDVSFNVANLKKVTMSLPSGKKELAELFDHILRRRIPKTNSLLGLRLVETLRFAYAIESDSQVVDARASQILTALLCSYLQDDIQSTINMPTKLLGKAEAAARIEYARNILRRHTAGLLELRDVTPKKLPSPSISQSRLSDPAVVFLHKDVAIYLKTPESRTFIQTSLTSVNLHSTYQMSLLNGMVAMAKIFCSEYPKDAVVECWTASKILGHTERILYLARVTEATDCAGTVVLLDEVDRIISATDERLPFRSILKFHIPNGLSGEFYPTLGTRNIGTSQHSNFLSLAVGRGLFHYVASKLRANETDAMRTGGLPLLGFACHWPRVKISTDFIQARTVKLLLAHGANPNEDCGGRTCWQVALNSLRLSETCQGSKYAPHFSELAEICRLLIEAGADPDACVEWADDNGIHYKRTAKEQIEVTFIQLNMAGPNGVTIAGLGTNLLALLERKKARREYSPVCRWR